MEELIKYVFLFAGLALFLVAGLGVVWQKRAALAAIPALLLVISANLDRIESFKASYQSAVIETKTRELTQTIDDANEAIRQIRELAAITAEALIDLRVNSHALVVDGVDIYKEYDDFKSKLIESLKKMKIPQEKLLEISRSDRSAVISFYAYSAYRFGRNVLPQDKWDEIDTYYNTQMKTGPLSPDQCQALLDRFHVDTTKFADYMADFRYYVEKGEQRRPEAWAHRESWGFGNLPQQ
jgi:hypothetical protein